MRLAQWPVVVALSVLWAATLITQTLAQAPTRGLQLFVGQLPLPGRITGHESALPTQASRCANCHLPAAPSAAAASQAGTQVFGPALTAGWLTLPARRRGAPPSAYSAISFCRLLRTGVDPAHVIIPRAMPRYEVTDADCHALWSFLAEPRP
jgi:hypothetical protein